MFAKGDFHIHSTASDGFLSPVEIVVTAKSRGIDILAITDHNTMAGVMEAATAGRSYGVSVIPGVEISTKYNGESIHILGYFKDESYKDNTFLKMLKCIKTHRIKKAKAILNSITSIENSSNHFSTLEGINLLRNFGAIVVLAHPVRITKKHLPELLTLPFDGIEAKYCNNCEEDTAYFINVASAQFSFYTGGSDFHTNKSKYLRHCIIGEPFLNSEEIQRFLKKSGVSILS
jgi:3',5'-nucleoside bisphosphate phosphatase